MDPRVEKLAQVLVHYSLELQAGQQFSLTSSPVAEELTMAVYREALQSGAHVYVNNRLPGATEAFYKLASDDQLDYVSPIVKLIREEFDATLYIEAERNTRELSNVDPDKQAHLAKTYQPISQHFYERAARKEVRWCLTLYPTNAAAQEADMSLGEYEDFVYEAGKLNAADPVAVWRAEAERMGELEKWLEGKDQVVIKGADVDLKLSINGRRFEVAAGTENFPDGEIFTGPVEDSVEGWVRFHYPAIYGGREVSDIELWFEDGKVVREQASKGAELLTSLLNTDEGARYLGEWGIGTNYSIPRFTKNMLFDEKLGGTIHLAVGSSYPETGGKNESGLHWDMLCDMSDGEITVDGEPFYRDGKPLAWSDD